MDRTAEKALASAFFLIALYLIVKNASALNNIVNAVAGVTVRQLAALQGR